MIMHDDFKVYMQGTFIDRDTSLRLALLNNDKIDVDKCKQLYIICNAMHFCLSVCLIFAWEAGKVIYLSKILVTKNVMT